MGDVVNIISPPNILNLAFGARFHQNCEAALSLCEH